MLFFSIHWDKKLCQQIKTYLQFNKQYILIENDAKYKKIKNQIKNNEDKGKEETDLRSVAVALRNIKIEMQILYIFAKF